MLVISPLVTIALASQFLPDNISIVGIEVYDLASSIITDSTTCPARTVLARLATPLINTNGGALNPEPLEVTDIDLILPLSIASSSL